MSTSVNLFSSLSYYSLPLVSTRSSGRVSPRFKERREYVSLVRGKEFFPGYTGNRVFRSSTHSSHRRPDLTRVDGVQPPRLPQSCPPRIGRHTSVPLFLGLETVNPRPDKYPVNTTTPKGKIKRESRLVARKPFKVTSSRHDSCALPSLRLQLCHGP